LWSNTTLKINPDEKLAYTPAKENAFPTSPAPDFFDTGKYPGERGLCPGESGYGLLAENSPKQAITQTDTDT
jgi:hypothetical protein